MSIRRFVTVCFVVLSCLLFVSVAQSQIAKSTATKSPISADQNKRRDQWFLRGRLVPGKSSAELRRRAYEAKLRMRIQRAAALAEIAHTSNHANRPPPPSSSIGSWVPLGPAPLASDASGEGIQDYHQVSGRATAVAIDPADSTGNTIYIGGAQAGIWKSTNAANGIATSVTWTPVADNQPTLSIGAIAIQPGNTDPTKTLILAATGEANNSADSYFGLGILRSSDGGMNWQLIPNANGRTLSFSGLGGTRMTFGNANTVVSAMATTAEGLGDGAITTNTMRGLYTSLDAGQTWSYNALLDPGNQATDATSATSVVYNASAGLFFAAIRYHGFYSSPDGVTWTRLATQPGGSALTTTACPPQSTANNQTCPIYRAEISSVPGRNETYAWFIYLDSFGNPVDGEIWQSLNSGASWTAISDTGITNCGDPIGCGVEQGYYNLELQAVPNGSATDLYAGVINLYKCSINSLNPTCNTTAFVNLTHAFGCDPIAAPAHVHPDQHALTYAIPTSGTDLGNALLYFANDGGIYRALNGFTGLATGSCSGVNQFDDLNQNLGSMTQFVSFSQHPTDANTMLGGAQGNGSPATSLATTSLDWQSILGGDGGYSAIDPTAPLNWYVTAADVPPGGLEIQECSLGVNCREIAGDYNLAASSSSLGGDDGGFYFPYILDPQSTTDLVVGTCRVWRGPRLGGAYTVLSPNFDTLGSGTCTGDEVNTVRALAAGGSADSNGSEVIYATTDGVGPLNDLLISPAGGNVWVTTNASAGTADFTEVTQSINPNQFPISGVVIDSSDVAGHTAYVSVMGFTGGPGHVWQTTNAGASWTDFTGSGISALPDSPTNAVVIDASTHMLFAATDVGVFQSGTTSPSWIELGPDPGTGQPGFLPNAAVTALGIFNSGGQKLLRASTYGRGIWQFNLNVTPDFQTVISNTPQTIFLDQTATFNGTMTATNGFANSVTINCTSGATSPPSTCGQTVITPGINTPFTVTASGAVGNYNFNLQAIGSDANQTTHLIPVTLQVVNFGMTNPSPSSIEVPDGTTSSPVSFQVTAAGSFDQSVALSCSVNITNAICNFTPGTTVTPTSTVSVNATASVTIPPGTPSGNYIVQLQAATAGVTPVTTSFEVSVTPNPTFIFTEITSFPEVNAGSTTVSGPIIIASQDGFSGIVALTCSLSGSTCSVSPASITTFPSTVIVTVSAATLSAGSYMFSVHGNSSATTNTLAVPFNVGDYQLTGTQLLTVAPGAQGAANLTLASSTFYSGKINATCDASALAGATCMLSPTNPITANAGTTIPVTATINVPVNAVLGRYNININTQDTTGAPSHSLAIVLNVSFIVDDFQLAISQAFPVSVDAGSQTTAKVTLTPNYAGTINANCDASALSGQCSITPANPVTISANTPVTLLLTLNVPNSAAPNATNLYSINLTASDTSGEPTHTLTLPLNVVQDFSVNSQTPSQTITNGQTSGAYQLTVAPAPTGSSFPGSVTLSCGSGLPPGAQCIFTPTSIIPQAGGPDVVMTISGAGGNLRLASLNEDAAESNKNVERHIGSSLWLFFPGLFLWAAFSIRKTSGRHHSPAVVIGILCLVGLASFAMTSCGGGGASNGGGIGTLGGGQQPVTYTIAVTGTAGALTHSTTVQLVVNP